MLAVLLLLPVGRSAELPLVIGGLAGLVLMLRGRISLRNPATMLATALFACWWLAALISALDAVAPASSWRTVASGLRFLPFAWFAGFALQRVGHWQRIEAAAAALVVLWALDAWLQMATGFSLGGPAEAERISGVFGAGNLKLGPVLGVLAAFPLVLAQRRWGLPGLMLAFALLAGPVLMAGSRAAWISFGVVLLLALGSGTGTRWRKLAVLVLAATLMAVMASLAVWQGSERFGARWERSLLALEGTPAALDRAAAGRLRIWSVSARMAAAHPLNGVGVRGFRHAYPAYARSGDDFVSADGSTGAAHPHQLVLEIATETGAIGLLLWLTGGVLALRRWRAAGAQARERARAPAIALAAACFPLNTHLAFYSAWWGLLFWWLLAVWCAALGNEGQTAGNTQLR